VRDDIPRMDRLWSRPWSPAGFGPHLPANGRVIEIRSESGPLPMPSNSANLLRRHNQPRWVRLGATLPGHLPSHPGDGSNPERARCRPPEADARRRSLAESTTKEIR
jgi:hypothetical protein